MINWEQGLVFGIIQGLTEFFPVSSSGHLALAQSLFKGFEQPGVLFDVAMHVATSVAVVVYFRKELVGLLKRSGDKEAEMSGVGKLERIHWTLVWPIVLAMIPTGIIGYSLKHKVESTFKEPIYVGYFLLITAVVLIAADFVARKNKDTLKAADPNLWQSIVIGIAQGLAVFPGISRSGSTISAGIFTGVRGDYAARFSFLLSVPAVLAAAALSVLKERHAITALSSNEILAYLLGMAAAFAVGYLTIGWMFKIVRRVRLSWFGIYCLVAGGATVIILSLR